MRKETRETQREKGEADRVRGEIWEERKEGREMSETESEKRDERGEVDKSVMRGKDSEKRGRERVRGKG